MLDLSLHALGVDAAFLVRLSGEGPARVLAARGVEAPEVADSPFCAQVWVSGRSRIQLAPPRGFDDPLLQALGAGFCAAVPLTGTHYADVLALTTHARPHPFSETDRRTLYFLAEIATAQLRADAWYADREAEHRQYRAYVEQSREGIWCVELDPPVPTALPVEEQVRLGYERGRIITCNDALAQMYGYEEAADLIDLPLPLLFPLDNPDNVRLVRRFIEANYRIYEVESQERDRTGRLRHFVNNITGIVENGLLRRVWGAQIDITARKQAEEALIRAKEEAEEMARLKTAFLTNMSHEIRTPLTSILGFAEILAEEVSDTHRELAELIRNGGERLMETLNSVLDLAQLEGRSLALRPQRIDLVGEALRVLYLFKTKAEARSLGLRVAVPTSHSVYAWLDPRAINRVLVNLVSNAVKFTQEGEVVVRITPGDDDLVIQVEDTGIGMAPEFMARIFSEFAQESRGMGRSYEGSGLGLAITKRLVELMGGTISVDSRKGVGTRFSVRFPATVMQAPETDPNAEA